MKEGSRNLVTSRKLARAANGTRALFPRFLFRDRFDLEMPAKVIDAGADRGVGVGFHLAIAAENSAAEARKTRNEGSRKTIPGRYQDRQQTRTGQCLKSRAPILFAANSPSPAFARFDASLSALELKA